MVNPTKIPFLDLITPHQELETELLAVVQKAFSNAGFIGGPMVEDFEREFAAFCDAKYCVGVNSGTDALRFAFMAAGIERGDIILTVPHTFIATTEAISQAGAQIGFIDIDEQSYTMDPKELKKYIEQRCEFDSGTGKLIERESKHRVAGIVPVHLYGQTADMDPILQLAAKYNLFVIEDACQAHGAEYYSKKEKQWRRAGTMGKAAAFSFYPTKNLSAYGEAGLVTTRDPEFAEHMRRLRTHGSARRYRHEEFGWNARMDAIQAAILRVKLPYIAEWNQQRRERAASYDQLLAQTGLWSAKFDSPLRPLQISPHAHHVFHQYVVRAKRRDELRQFLTDRKIGTEIYYPIPLHLQPCFAYLGYREGDLPVSERASKEVLALPMFPELTESEQKWVVESMAEFYS